MATATAMAAGVWRVACGCPYQEVHTWPQKSSDREAQKTMPIQIALSTDRFFYEPQSWVQVLVTVG